jgi:hypothetical protein
MLRYDYYYYYYYYHYYYYYGSTALCCALTAFSVSWSYIQSAGLLRQEISPTQGRYLHTGEHKHRINAHRHPCLEWDSNPRSQRSSERRQFMPQTVRPLWPASVRASEDSSCLRPRGHCDRLASERAKTVALDRAAHCDRLASERAMTVHALDRSTTVTG